jgi:hypothetical protein
LAARYHPKAAAAFDQPAAMVDAIPEDVLAVFSKRRDVDDGLLDVEQWTEMLRDVGFRLPGFIVRRMSISRRNRGDVLPRSC